MADGRFWSFLLLQVAVSSGSACTSASLEPSYVLRALGVDDELAHTSLRFGTEKPLSWRNPYPGETLILEKPLSWRNSSTRSPL